MAVVVTVLDDVGSIVGDSLGVTVARGVDVSDGVVGLGAFFTMTGVAGFLVGDADGLALACGLGDAVATDVGVKVAVAEAVGVAVSVGVGVGVAVGVGRTHFTGQCTYIKVAVCPARAAVIVPAAVNLPV